MWIASKHGFFSIVEKRRNQFHVRARVKRDLENLLRAAKLTKTVGLCTSFDADYRFRVVVNYIQLTRIFGTALLNSIDYDNFKGLIARTPDQVEKLDSYHRIWAELLKHQK